MDWKLIISELQSAGITQVQIAQICGCGQATVSELRTGLIFRPNYELGTKLLDLRKRNIRKINKAKESAVA
jgi:transcriptional regulator with XRE-family HTH domain